MNKANAILHPVRMKIIQHLSRGPASGYEIVNKLPHIPQATLYRHLKVLSKENIVHVIEEKKIRGALEKTYALRKDGARIQTKEFMDMREDEKIQLFTTLYFQLLDRTEEYIKSMSNIEGEPFGFNQLELELTEEEFTNMRTDLINIYKKYNEKEKDDPNRRTVNMFQIFLPDKE